MYRAIGEQVCKNGECIERGATDKAVSGPALEHYNTKQHIPQKQTVADKAANRAATPAANPAANRAANRAAVPKCTRMGGLWMAGRLAQNVSIDPSSTRDVREVPAEYSFGDQRAQYKEGTALGGHMIQH